MANAKEEPHNSSVRPTRSHIFDAYTPELEFEPDDELVATVTPLLREADEPSRE